MVIIAVLFCICFCLMPCRAQAASTADAKEWIDPARECTLTLSYRYDGAACSGVPVSLYQIADISADFRYTLTAPFRPTGLFLNGVQSVGEWNAIRSTLESHILANRVAALHTAETDPAGQVSFDALKPGLYLATAGRVEQDGVSCSFDAALVALPGLGTDGLWQYQVTAAAKPSATTIPGGGSGSGSKKVEFKILKLWKGDEGKSDRPRSVEVEIFRDGVSEGTVTLSEEGNWSYSWMAEDDGTNWMVAERNVPEGYTVTLERRGTAFVLTNTLQEEPFEEDPTEDPTDDPTEPPSEKDDTSETETKDHPPKEPPKTGDTPHILLYFALMYVSGTVLVLLGIAGKRKGV